MRLLKHQDTALMVVAHLSVAKDPGLTSLADISREHGISVSYLKKIARLLKSAGLIRSREGRRGGYELGTDPALISVWDVVMAVDQAKKLKEYDRSVIGACPLHSFCLPQIIRSRVGSELKQAFSKIRIKDLIKGG